MHVQLKEEKINNMNLVWVWIQMLLAAMSQLPQPMVPTLHEQLLLCVARPRFCRYFCMVPDFKYCVYRLFAKKLSILFFVISAHSQTATKCLSHSFQHSALQGRQCWFCFHFSLQARMILLCQYLQTANKKLLSFPMFRYVCSMGSFSFVSQGFNLTALLFSFSKHCAVLCSTVFKGAMNTKYNFVQFKKTGLW